MSIRHRVGSKKERPHGGKQRREKSRMRRNNPRVRKLDAILKPDGDKRTGKEARCK